jgi:hypothetical protein
MLALTREYDDLIAARATGDKFSQRRLPSVGLRSPEAATA